MKYFLLLFVFCFSLRLYAQENLDSSKKQKQIFIRLYDNKYKKIGKGNLLYGFDSTIEIMRNSKFENFTIQQVFYIKTKRSAGHSILIGTAVGTATGLILIASSSDQHSSGFGPDQSLGQNIAGVAAPIVGIVSGVVVAALRKTETFQIDGNIEKWDAARKKILGIE